MAKGMGFKAASADIQRREGVSSERAGAILASSTRKASAKAKRANPNLKKVAASSKSSKPSNKRRGKRGKRR